MRNSALSEWPDLQNGLNRVVGKATRSVCTFVLFVKIMTRWPVQDINGNKDIRAYEKKTDLTVDLMLSCVKDLWRS